MAWTLPPRRNAFTNTPEQHYLLSLFSTRRVAFEEYGVPQETLSDNGLSFNQGRRGTIGATETFLAEHGCRGITERIWHPQTQGKMNGATRP